MNEEKEYRTIHLTKNKIAIVDANDYEWLSKWKWQASWNQSSQSYYAVHSMKVAGKTIKVSMHRLILGLNPGDIRNGDHRNHDTLDNRRNNLRIATFSQNKQNSLRRKDNNSGFKGVSWDSEKRKWRVRIAVDGRPIRLGRFASLELAHAAYCDAAKKYHREFFNEG